MLLFVLFFIKVKLALIDDLRGPNRGGRQLQAAVQLRSFTARAVCLCVPFNALQMGETMVNICFMETLEIHRSYHGSLADDTCHAVSERYHVYQSVFADFLKHVSVLTSSNLPDAR